MREKRKEKKQNSQFIDWPKENDKSKGKSFEDALSNYLFFKCEINFLNVPWGMKKKDQKETKH